MTNLLCAASVLCSLIAPWVRPWPRTAAFGMAAGLFIVAAAIGLAVFR